MRVNDEEVRKSAPPLPTEEEEEEPCRDSLSSLFDEVNTGSGRGNGNLDIFF
jgi:hypothetical protein